MSEITYKIDAARTNSFYHYTKYSDGVSVGKGWTYYMKLTSEADKEAWLKAVSEYNKEHQIVTEADKIKAYTKQIREKLKAKPIYGEKKDPVMPGIASVLSLIKGGDIAAETEDEFLQKIMEPMGGSIPTPKAMFEYAWKAEIYNAKVDIDNARVMLTNLGVEAFVTPVLDKCDEMVDIYFEKISLLYNEVQRICSKALYYYNRYKEITDTSEAGKKRKEEYLNKFKEECVNLSKKYGKEIMDMLYMFLCVDQIKSILESIKSFQRTASSTWQSLVSDFKSMLNIDLEELLSDKTKQLKLLLDNLLSLLAALAGALIAQRCSEEQCADADKAGLADALGTTPDNVEDKQRKKTENAALETAKGTTIYKNALNNKEGYSLYYSSYDVEGVSDMTTLDSSVATDASLMDVNCKVSMCEYENPLDFYDIVKGSPVTHLVGGNEIIVEFDSNMHASIVVSKGSDIIIDEPIAYINDAPVKSITNFHVTDVSTNYIIGSYNIGSDIFVDDFESLSESVTKSVKDCIEGTDDSAYRKIIDEYNEMSYVDTFIREYISYFRYPELAQYTREHVSGDATELSTEDFIEEYEAVADEYYDEYCEAVKDISSKKNVEDKVNKNDILGLKKQMTDKRAEYYANIINLYNQNPGNLKYCSKGRIVDFMLYDNYLNYITGDRFNYDEDNPYIVRLSNAINTFMGIRQRVELNKDNIDGLIKKFNELCDENIKTYWTWKSTPYYEKLSDLFKGDYYMDTEEITPAEKGDNTITLYSKVFGFLKAITKFTKKAEETVEYDESKDINKILEEQGKRSADSLVDKASFEFEKKLKHIAFMFMSLRQIETSMTAANISEYISKTEFDAAMSLHKTIGDAMYEYEDGKTYGILDPLYNKASVLGPYIKMFKKITAAEVVILREIVQDVLSWNDTHSEKLLDGSLLTSLASISWPSVSIIYHNSNKVDYYLFKEDYTDKVPKTFDELEKMVKNMQVHSDENMNSPTYPDTAARQDRILYWLKYCGIATLVNLMIPIYWGTGLILPTGPLKLPIIYVPIYYVSGRVGFLIGLGICGIAIYPMLLFTNIGNLKGSILVPINMAVDFAIKMLQQFANMSFKVTVDMVNPLVSSLDEAINKAEQEREDVDYQIEEVKKTRTSTKVKKAFSRTIGEDPTFQAQETPDYDKPDFFEELSKAQGEIDYDDIINRLDEITKEYDPSYKDFESIIEALGMVQEEYNDMTNGDSGYTITGATDVTLTYELFDKVYKLRNKNKSAPRDVYEAIMSSFNDSLKTLSNPSNYDKVADLSAYLANIAVETNFAPVREFATYTSDGILKTFTGHFDKNGNQKFFVNGQNHDVNWYANHGQDLFNYVYMVNPSDGKAGRGGNQLWGEGYKYRGGGFTQLTFKDGYKKMDTHLKSFYKKDFGLLDNPDNISRVDAAAYSMAAYWTNYNGANNAHNVWTKSPNTASEIANMNPSASNMPCYNAKTGGYKDFVSDTERKYIMCYKLVAGSYPADNRSETGKKTYEAKGKYFKQIYRILTENNNSV